METLICNSASFLRLTLSQYGIAFDLPAAPSATPVVIPNLIA